jgi:hypothetical protein
MTDPMPCPVCGRLDGGHNKDMHDVADGYPARKKAGGA